MKKITKALIPLFMIFFVCVACGQADTSESTSSSSQQDEATQSEQDKQTKENKSKEVDKKSDDSEKKKSSTSKEKENKKQSNKKKAQKKQTTSSKKLDNLEVHYIDVGQADATLFIFGDRAILYDTGDWTRNDTVEYLKEKNITKLDLVIISHPHADHIGQLSEVMKEFDVDEVWMTGHEHTSQVATNALQAVLDSNANYLEPRTGETFKVGDMKLAVTHPET